MPKPWQRIPPGCAARRTAPTMHAFRRSSMEVTRRSDRQEGLMKIARGPMTLRRGSAQSLTAASVPESSCDGDAADRVPAGVLAGHEILWATGAARIRARDGSRAVCRRRGASGRLKISSASALHTRALAGSRGSRGWGAHRPVEIANGASVGSRAAVRFVTASAAALPQQAAKPGECHGSGMAW